MTYDTDSPAAKSVSQNPPVRPARDWVNWLIVLTNALYAAVMTGQLLAGTGRATGVWFAVPLALAHAALSSARLHHLEPPGVLLFGTSIAFAAFEWFALGRRRHSSGRGGAWTHAGLVVAGLGVAVLIYAASYATIGPWDHMNDRPPGPPPSGS